jgi:hypothetical protein
VDSVSYYVHAVTPMAHVSDDFLRDVLRTYEASGSNAEATARAMGKPGTTVKNWLKIAQRRNVTLNKPQFEVAPIPSEHLSREELIAFRKKQFQAKRAHQEAKRLRDVRVRLIGPIGIVHFGDPHVDDDGTDIGLLEDHMQIVKKTEGLFGANLGDLSNNWIGRLARLWAQQGTSSAQAWQLVEWMCHYIDWLYLVGGNHDAWSGTGDPLKWIMGQAQTAFDYSGVRINLKFPNGKAVRINARHDFSGNSMWNPAHGPMKAVQGGWRDHMLTCGHKHTSFVGGPLKDPATGLLSWSIRCAGYKVFDRYVEENGFPDQNAFPACVTIIDPRFADDDTRLITVIPDVAEGADFLKWKRRKAA